MAEPFSILKALDFSFPAIGKSVSVVIKGLLVLGIIGVVCWSGYVTFIKPHTDPTPTTTQTGGISNTYNIKPLFGFGCMRIPVKSDKK